MLTPEIVGQVLPPRRTSWTNRDCALYALGIGAGQNDPTSDLAFTTENSMGQPQVVYPTFGVISGASAGVGSLLEVLGDAVDFTQMLHGQQGYVQQNPLPAAATVTITGHIVAAWDKQSATVIETEAQIADEESGTVYGRSTQTLFFRGIGGWGGERGPSLHGENFDRPPDRTLQAYIPADQALLYRLSGDSNPLHSDPKVAALAGFERPILHGLCTYGYTGRLLLEEFAQSRPDRFVWLAARFSKPTLPGDTITIATWTVDDGVAFVVSNQHGDVLLTDGSFAFHSAVDEEAK